MKALGVSIIRVFFLSSLLLMVSSAYAGPQNYDGDTNNNTGEGLDDLVLFDASTSEFQIRNSSDGAINNVVVSDGSNPAGNVPAPLDRDGDGDLDPTTFNRSNGRWFFNVGGQISTEDFSDDTPGNVPVPGSFGGNDCDDLGVYNPLTKTFKTKDCVTQTINTVNDPEFGQWPIIGDFDGDGLDDLGTWDIDPATGYGKVRIHDTASQQGRTLSPFGLPGDIPLATDFDGDDDDDPALFRPYQFGSFSSLFIVMNPDDIHTPWLFPWVPGDFPNLLDTVGRGRADLAVFRAALASFFVRTSLPGVDFLGLFFNTFSAAAGSLPLTPNQFIRPAVPGDATRDGKSDFAVVTQNGIFMQWNWLPLDGSLIQYIFGFNSDTPLVGDLDGDKLEQPVVVRETGGFFDWYARLLGGNYALLFTPFGLAGDTPLMGDLDCDGKDEPIVVRNIGGSLLWFWLKSAMVFGEMDTHSWGLAGDTPFVADMNGDGCDDMVVARPFNGGIFWAGHNKRANQSVTTMFGLADDTPFPPADFNGDGAADPVVIRDLGSQRIAYIRMANGSARAVNLGRSSTPAAGNFSGLPQAEFAEYNQGRLFGTDTVTLHRYDGKTQVIGLPQSPGTGTVVAPLVGEAGSALGCSEIREFFRPELYKPFSDAVPRHGVVLFDDNVWRRLASLQFFDVNNQFIGSDIRRVCCPNGGRAHYWLPISSTALLGSAPITVKLTFTDGSNTCRIIPNPTRRYE